MRVRFASPALLAGSSKTNSPGGRRSAAKSNILSLAETIITRRFAFGTARDIPVFIIVLSIYDTCQASVFDSFPGRTRFTSSTLRRALIRFLKRLREPRKHRSSPTRPP